MVSNRRSEAIAYALRTTGTILWCGTGVYSGDGRKALDTLRLYTVPEETKRYLRLHCTRFTQQDQISACHRASYQMERCQRLAKLAIDCGKFESAIKLIHHAEFLQDAAKDYRKGERVIYRINQEVK